MPTLHRGEYFIVEYFQASRYVRLARTARAFDSPDDARATLAECERALREIDLASVAILLDWRLAPLAVDPTLHETVVTCTDAFAARFARRALLVQTPVGKLQLDRIVRQQSATKPIVFNDEAEAIEYVTTGVLPSRRR